MMFKYRHERSVIVEEWLHSAGILLWREHLKLEADKNAMFASDSPGVTMRRDRFLKSYDGHCCNILASVVHEWFNLYDCAGCFKDFYAQKMRTVAWLYMFGESRRGELRDALESKPNVSIVFFYDNDAWEALSEE